MSFLALGWFGPLLTIVALVLCAASVVSVEFSLGSDSRRRLLLWTTGVFCVIWFAVIVARFVFISSG